MKTTLKQIGIILLFSGVVSFFANSVHPRKIPWVQRRSNQVEAKARKAGIKVIPFSVALQKFQSLEVVFIDARPVAEFETGHIAGAVSIPFQSLDSMFPTVGNLIDSRKELVVYCSNRACDDSLLLATELQAMGAENLTIFVDGFDVWKQYGGASSTLPEPVRAADGVEPVPPNQGSMP